MINIGDVVRLNRAARTEMFWRRMMAGGGSIDLKSYSQRQHVREFRRSIGIVEGYAFDDTTQFVNVRWKTRFRTMKCSLRYAYRHDQLEKV